MATLEVTTLTGDAVALASTTLAAFQAQLRGPVLCPSDTGYEAARTLWNAHIATRPALLVRCMGVADVLASITFARTHQLLVAVRGGGHNFPGTSLCAGGMVIDLSLMTSVRVEARTQTARAEGGAKWGHFDRETQAFGLATTGGTDSDTGIGGLTLGGGLGWLGGHYGLACDNLLAADVVTAEG
jgi:FAD/FMN-containing dehydrogenase